MRKTEKNKSDFGIFEKVPFQKRLSESPIKRTPDFLKNSLFKRDFQKVRKNKGTSEFSKSPFSKQTFRKSEKIIKGTSDLLKKSLFKRDFQKVQEKNERDFGLFLKNVPQFSKIIPQFPKTVPQLAYTP